MSNRKLKKFRKNSYLMMDLAAIPSGTSVDDWLRIMNEHKLLIWDSENNRGKLAKPKDYQPFKFIATTRIKCPYKIININNYDLPHKIN